MGRDPAACMRFDADRTTDVTETKTFLILSDDPFPHSPGGVALLKEWHEATGRA